jgi:hypothetical protein
MRLAVLVCALLGAPYAAFAQVAEPAAPPRDLYVRGAFNGWGTDNRLVERSRGVLETDITVSPGNHAFKIGSQDWRVEWVLDPNASLAVLPDRAYPLAVEAGKEDFLFARQAATYRFRVDAADPAHPVLTVTRIADAATTPAIDPHAGAGARAALRFATWDGNEETARFSVRDARAPLRAYVQSTTLGLRDPGLQWTAYTEDAALPRVRSSSLAFDALFALAGHEMRQDSVKEIRDGNYNGGAAIPCDCFETGEKWHYVWTRDLSYAADLGLAMLDPERVRRSLLFKLSGWRAGIAIAPQVAGTADGVQVVQDTGSGGSWPVSTDRVAWAFAAEETLKALAPAEGRAFAAQALAALANTIENDRIAAFDRATGLYTGEESFLDWRDQSYAAWIPDDLSSMASSAALSTNAAHYKALRVAARLARAAGGVANAARAARWEGWARDVKHAIDARLWLEDAGMYGSLTSGHFDGAPLHRFDWLGQSLAVVTGIADAPRARRIVASYPHGPMGAPVIWPQQPDQPVYHNRAIWPFVTAYGLRAAIAVRNVAVADAAYDTLLRGAALNLSNMENLEWLSGQPLLLDEAHPGLTGPVIDSRRQLWSVGAYLGMVVRDVFGVSTTAAGIRLDPFVTARLGRTLFGAGERATLNNLRLRGHALDVTLRLGPNARASRTAPGDGYYTVERILLDGRPARADIRWSRLGAGSRIEVVLGRLATGDGLIRRVNANPYGEDAATFGPREPVLAGLARADGANRLTIAAAAGADAPGAGVAYNVWRDGRQVATGLAAGPWTDPDGGAYPAACYALEAQYTGSGNRSHHSRPRCVAEATAIAIDVGDVRMHTNLPLLAAGGHFAEARVAGWGAPADRFEVDMVRVPQDGRYAIQVRYHNGANQPNLGISGGVKWLAIEDAAGVIVAQGVVQMPHARVDKTATPPVYSTPLAARLARGAVYRIRMVDFYNMSYLESNRTFGAAGGAAGPSNRIDILGVRLLRTQP